MRIKTLMDIAKKAECDSAISDYEESIEYLETNSFINIAVLGDSGSGKTTLINRLAGAEVRHPSIFPSNQKPLRVIFKDEEAAATTDIDVVKAENSVLRDVALNEIIDIEEFISDGKISPQTEKTDAIIYVMSAYMVCTASDIGKQIDTSELDIEIENYRKKLCEVNINKSRLENEMDTMPADEPHRDRKIHDMSVRLNSMYDVIIDIEQRIEDAYRRRKGVEMNALTLENIYKILLQFDKIYDIISDEDKKNLISSLVSEIQIFRNDEPHSFPIKSMTFNFPVMYNGNEVNQLVWENDTTLETVILLSGKTPDDVIHVDLDLDELDIT